jgi:integrase
MPYFSKKKKGRQKWVACIRRTVEGRVYRREHLCMTEREAKAWESTEWNLSDEEFLAVVQKTNTEYCLLDLCNDYLDFSKKYVPEVQKEKKRVFQRLFDCVDPYMSVRRFADRPKLVLDFSNTCYQELGGNVVNNSIVKNLKAAWNWGKKFIPRFPNVSPFDLIDKYPETRKPRYVPPIEDFWTVYEGKYPDPPTDQDKLMLLTYLYTGARRSEVFRLRISSDIDFAASTIRLIHRKNAGRGWEEAVMPMLDDLYELLLAHVQTCKTDFLFVHPETSEPFKARSHIMERWCKRAGVRPFGWHAIRHLTATVMAQKDVPMEQIKQILRHKNQSTTEKYIGRLGIVKRHLEVLSNPNRRLNGRQTKSNKQNNLKVVPK